MMPLRVFVCDRFLGWSLEVHARNGFSTLSPVFSKSLTLRVTMVKPWRCAVAAIWLSKEGTLIPAFSHVAFS